MNMKKLIILISCIVLAMLILLIGSKLYSRYHNQNTNKSEVNYYSAMSIADKGDGWYYYFKIDRNLNGTIFNYSFNGQNIKHEYIEDFYIYNYDNKGNIIDKEQARFPILSHNIDYAPEIKNINDYFIDKSYDHPIKIEDLEDLDLKYFSKEDILNLFNDAINKEYVMNFGDIYYGLTDQTEEKDGTKWQIGTITNYGYAYIVRIDYIDKTGSLRDKVEKKENYDEEMYQTILDIEKSLINEGLNKTVQKYQNLPNVYEPLLILLRNNIKDENTN